MFYAIGDIHGEVETLRERLAKIEDELNEDNVYFLLGDVGLGYGHKSIKKTLFNFMEKTPGTFLVMRGNHDNRYIKWLQEYPWVLIEPEEWNGMTVWAEKTRPSVKFLPDEGGMFTINGYNCLVIPGAFSVDKDIRIAYNEPYEPGEVLTTQELNKLIDLSADNDISFAFSHTAPFAWDEAVSFAHLPTVDQNKVNKSTEKAMDFILENSKDTMLGWYFGHFHHDFDCGENNVGHMLFNEVKMIKELS